MGPHRRLFPAASSPLALVVKIYLCACPLLLLGGGFASTARSQVIKTVAGGFNASTAESENFCLPIRALATQGTDVYLISCNQIIKVASNGAQTVVAGNGIEGFSGDGGLATSASLGGPRGIREFRSFELDDTAFAVLVCLPSAWPR